MNSLLNKGFSQTYFDNQYSYDYSYVHLNHVDIHIKKLIFKKNFAFISRGLVPLYFGGGCSFCMPFNPSSYIIREALAHEM